MKDIGRVFEMLCLCSTGLDSLISYLSAPVGSHKRSPAAVNATGILFESHCI